jgi:peptidoglycan DL-endopeptidase CwlO
VRAILDPYAPALVSQGALAAVWPTILAFLQAQLGKPYAWGAIGPDSYDCSGLVMMAFRAAGIALPRTSELQYATTVSGTIPYAQAQPGDLLFSEGNPPGHVRVYVGNGLAISAPHTGVNVRIEPVAIRPC